MTRGRETADVRWPRVADAARSGCCCGAPRGTCQARSCVVSQCVCCSVRLTRSSLPALEADTDHKPHWQPGGQKQATKQTGGQAAADKQAAASELTGHHQSGMGQGSGLRSTSGLGPQGLRVSGPRTGPRTGSRTQNPRLGAGQTPVEPRRRHAPPIAASHRKQSWDGHVRRAATPAIAGRGGLAALHPVPGLSRRTVRDDASAGAGGPVGWLVGWLGAPAAWLGLGVSWGGGWGGAGAHASGIRHARHRQLLRLPMGAPCTRTAERRTPSMRWAACTVCCRAEQSSECERGR